MPEDTDKMLALLQKLGAVEWPGWNSLHWAPKSKVWFKVHQFNSGGQVCCRETTLDEDIALCLLIHAALERLEQKWEEVSLVCRGVSYRVDLYSATGYETYSGKTKLDALLAACEAELDVNEENPDGKD